MHVLAFPATIESLRGRWVIFTYDQSFASRPVRPLLRMVRRAGPPIEAVLPAAFLGRARWLGLMPDDLVDLEFRIGLDDPGRIRLLPVERLSVWQVWRRLLARDPMAFLGDVVPCLNRSLRIRTNMMRARLMQEPPDRLAEFARSRTRPLETDGFDRPVAAEAAPSIDLSLACSGTTTSLLAATIAGLLDQADPCWTLTIIPDSAKAGAFARAASADPRVRVTAAAGRQAAQGWTGRLAPGDMLAPWAILAARAEIAARPNLALLYTDCATLDARGELREAALLPGWSPALLRERDYMVGLRLLAPALSAPRSAEGAAAALPRAAEALRFDEVNHLPRLALLRADDSRLPAEASSPEPPRHPARPRSGAAASLSVSIVMPTRDRLDLLRPAVESVLAGTAPVDLELVVADNGSADLATLAYLREIDGTRRTRVIEIGGAFNFSRIVNAGVAAGTGEMVVLLNNDIEVIEPGWLAEMLDCLDSPDIGAVGAKLLYPNGTLQHAGTVVGWGATPGISAGSGPRMPPSPSAALPSPTRSRP